MEASLVISPNKPTTAAIVLVPLYEMGESDLTQYGRRETCSETVQSSSGRCRRAPASIRGGTFAPILRLKTSPSKMDTDLGNLNNPPIRIEAFYLCPELRRYIKSQLPFNYAYFSLSKCQHNRLRGLSVILSNKAKVRVGFQSGRVFRGRGVDKFNSFHGSFRHEVH